MARGTWHTDDGVNWYYDAGFYNTGDSPVKTCVRFGFASFDPSREQLEQWFKEGEPARLVHNRWLIRLMQARRRLRSWGRMFTMEQTKE